MRVGRALSITFGIAVVGALIGGVMGTIVFIVWRSVNRILPFASADASAVAFGAVAGACLGAVLAPLTSWLFLRRVPLGAAILQTTIGTTVGAAVGLALDGSGLTPKFLLPASLLGAIAGFLAAAIRLRFFRRTPGREAGTESSRPASGT